MRHLRNIATQLKRVGSDTSGLALLEFAFVTPVFLLFALGGTELTNYVITRMRISQAALQLADNAARIGTGTQLQAKTISEADINDLLEGAALQSSDLDLFGRGRVVISSLEPVPNTTDRYRIRWQRCRGVRTSYTPLYGTVADSQDIPGMGPANRQAIAAPDGVTMFVEVYYEYKPLFTTAFTPPVEMRDSASMMVRDRRDTSDDSATTNLHPYGVYKVNGVTASTC